jgi:hypothetical protein
VYTELMKFRRLSSPISLLDSTIQNQTYNADSMASPAPKLRSNGLTNPQRYITDHDTQGKAVLSTSVASEGEWQKVGPVADFFLGYTTRTFPASLSPAEAGSSALPKDIESYKNDLAAPPGLSISTGIISTILPQASCDC